MIDLQVRGGRQNWGSYAVYRGGWGPQRELRGRRGGHRMPPPGHSGRPPSSARSGVEWGHGSDSELSGDEVSASTESGKEDAGRIPGSGSGSRRADRDTRRPPR